MVRVISNQKTVVAQIDRQIQQTILQSALDYERLLQEEYRAPKTGHVYGAETEVSFDATGGGEKEVTFASKLTDDVGRIPVDKRVTFTANKGQKASKRAIKFVANRGKKWRDGKRNTGMHRASAPGEAPAIQTGALRKGISRVIKKLGPMRWSVTIGVSVQSGRGGPTGTSDRSIIDMLEFGTKHMKPRPSFRAALEKFRQAYRATTKKRATRAKKG